MNTPATPATTATPTTRTYTNAALTAIAVLLGVLTLGHSGAGPSAALAQQGSQREGDDGLVSAAEQRKAIIAELRQLNTRIEHLDAALSRTVNVKVLEMPPVQMMDKSAAPASKPSAPIAPKRG